MIGFDFSSGMVDIAKIPKDVEFVICDLFHPQIANVRSTVVNSGLLFGVFQGYLSSSWTTPSEAESRAISAVDIMKSMSYSPGSVCFLDCESSSATAAENTTWLMTWGKIIVDSGYQPGFYIGGNFVVDLKEIATYFDIFWKSVSLSGVPNVIPLPDGSERFYDLYQVSNSTSLAGMTVDIDLTHTDNIHWDMEHVTIPAADTTPTVATPTPTTTTRSNTKTITVVSGMTLWSLTKGDWGLIHEIQKLNNMGNSSILNIGQKILVPNNLP